MYEAFDVSIKRMHDTATLNVRELNELYNRFSTMETLAAMAEEISNRQTDDERFVFSPFHTGTLHTAIQILGTDGRNAIEALEVTPRSK